MEKGGGTTDEGEEDGEVCARKYWWIGVCEGASVAAECVPEGGDHGLESDASEGESEGVTWDGSVMGRNKC